MENNLRVAAPIPYQACHEILEEGEVDTQAKILETLHSISETT